MANLEHSRRFKLSLAEAIKDLGWYPALYATVVGAPSWLALLQALRGARLSEAFQWIVDGYTQLTAEMALWIEPVILPAINWLNSHLFGSLTLHPHWRPLFILQMVFSAAIARTTWRGGFRSSAVTLIVCSFLCALVGSVAAGLAPFDGPWWAQGVMAAMPALTLFGSYGIARWVNTGDAWYIRATLHSGALTAVILFALSSALSPLVRGAGIWVFALCLGVMGTSELLEGLVRGKRQASRAGLMVLGGLVVAGSILVADAALKTIG